MLKQRNRTSARTQTEESSTASQARDTTSNQAVAQGVQSTSQEVEGGFLESFVAQSQDVTEERASSEATADPVVERRSHFERLSRDLFPRLDRGEDGFVSDTDIDHAMTDPTLTQAEAATLVTLRRLRTRLEEMSDDELFDENDGITLADIQAFGDAGELPGETHTPDAWLLHTMGRIRGMSTELFANGLPDVSAMRQGSIGDCYFLAGLGSMIAQNPQAVVDMIEAEDNGTYTVTFPNGQAVNVPAPTFAEMATYGSSGSDGMWVTLLESAAGAVRDPDALIPIEELDGGSFEARAGASLLSRAGTVNVDDNPFTSDATTAERMERAFAEGRVVIAGIRGAFFADDREGLPMGHAYSVLDYDRDADRITIRNPWGRSELEGEDGTPLDGVDDGTFTLNMKEYNRLFTQTAFAKTPFEER